MRGLVNALRFSEVGSEFKSTCGEGVYAVHSGPFVVVAMAKLKVYCVVTNPVELTCLKDTQPNAMFAKLVPETPIKDLIFDVASSQSGSLRNLVSEWPHHKLLESFREFLDATALATVPLLCLKAVSADSEGVPTRDALLFLQMSVFIRDVTMMAATLHNELFVGAGCGWSRPARPPDRSSAVPSFSVRRSAG
jgi:hypothetical protein